MAADSAPPPIADAPAPEAAPAAADAGPGAGVSDPGTEGDGDFMVSGPYRLPPEATLASGVTAGKIAQVMVASRIFAGSNRAVQVYTPAGYVAGTAAPFMVLQDGPGYINNFRLNTVLDNLIASKKLPVMIAIFVPNGGSNRSFEYDSLTDLYVRFVLEEVLPAVEGGLPVKLTRDPEGRAAGGHSSGGIAAFTMGWLRPDQFRRILTHSGSFTNIRGGDRYPALVRGEPAKPLRVFLSAGTMDLQPPRWQQANVTMAAALKETGYHYRFVLMTGGTHSQSHPAAILPETLLWLWRGYPIP
jgi:enterochelin esterase family protein